MKENKIMHYLSLMRVKQWHKSFLIFAPLVLSLNYNLNTFVSSLCLFISFVTTSSVIYIFNDINDLDEDKKHKIKKYRPIAAGYISKRHALFFMYFLIFFTVCSFYFLKKDVIYLLVAYITVNIFYTFFIKRRYFYLGILIVSLGFIIRLITGSLQTETPISKWFILCVFIASIIIIFSKRYSDSFFSQKKENKINRAKIKSLILLTSIILIIVYISFTFSIYAAKNFSAWIHISTLFLTLALVRFVRETIKNKLTSDPSIFILRDHYFLLYSFTWFIFFISSKIFNYA